MAQVFISYSRKDKDFVTQLAAAFKAHEREVWVDWEGIPLASAWWKEIEQGIEEADNFVFVLSPDSVASEVCAAEIAHALKYNKRLIPIVARDGFPSAEVHPTLAAINWIFFSGGADFDNAFNALLTTLDTDLEHVRGHTRLLQRALEWDSQNHDSSLLLHGSDLKKAENWLSTGMQLHPKPTELQTRYIIVSGQAQGNRQRRRFFATIGVLVVTAVLAIQAHQQRHYALKQRNVAMINEIKSLNALSEARLVTHKQLEALVASVKAGRQVNQVQAKPELLRRSRHHLQEVVYAIDERNRFDGHAGTVHGVRFSPDGKYLVSAGSRQTLVWQNNGALMRELVQSAPGRSVAFHPLGQSVAVATADGAIKHWSLTGELLGVYQHPSEIKAIIFTPDGLLISAGRDHRIQIWGNDGQLLRTLESHGGSVEGLAVSPDGWLLASAGADNTVKLWRLRDGVLLDTLYGHTDRVYGVDFSPDSKLLASAGADNTVRLWRYENGAWNHEAQVLKAHLNWVYAVRFSPDGRRLASAGADKTVKVWSREGTLLKSLAGHQAGVRDLSFSPDGKRIASGSVDRTIRLRSLEGTLIEILQGHSSSLKNVAFSPDGKLIASVSTDKTLKLWHGDGTLWKDIAYQAGLRSVDFSPDGQYFAVAGYDKTVQIRRRDGTLEKSRQAHDSTVKTVVYAPDGSMLASCSSDRTIKLWQPDLTPVLTLYGHQDAVNDVAFHPDGKRLASGGADNRVKLWQTDGTLLHTLSGHDDWVNAVAFSPDGTYLASASSDKTVRLWNPDSGELVRILEGHTEWVWQVKFHPREPLIATASSDNSVGLWTPEGKLLTSLREHSDWVRAVSFSPDGHKLASASADQTVVLWNLDTVIQLREQSGGEGMDSLLAKGCAWLKDYLQTNRLLSEEERRLCEDI